MRVLETLLLIPSRRRRSSLLLLFLDSKWNQQQHHLQYPPKTQRKGASSSSYLWFPFPVSLLLPYKPTRRRQEKNNPTQYNTHTLTSRVNGDSRDALKSNHMTAMTTTVLQCQYNPRNPWNYTDAEDDDDDVTDDDDVYVYVGRRDIKNIIIIF